jgi:hypothetical protein
VPRQNHFDGREDVCRLSGMSAVWPLPGVATSFICAPCHSRTTPDNPQSSASLTCGRNRRPQRQSLFGSSPEHFETVLVLLVHFPPGGAHRLRAVLSNSLALHVLPDLPLRPRVHLRFTRFSKMAALVDLRCILRAFFPSAHRPAAHGQFHISYPRLIAAIWERIANADTSTLKLWFSVRCLPGAINTGSHIALSRPCNSRD